MATPSSSAHGPAGRREFYTPDDIRPDDQRFIMAHRADPGVGDEKPLLITEGWFTELQRPADTNID